MILDLVQSQKDCLTQKAKLICLRINCLKKGWGVNGCPFVLVFPYMTVPNMIQDKIIHSVLGVKNDKSSN
jgi:hypothetical protein